MSLPWLPRWWQMATSQCRNLVRERRLLNPFYKDGRKDSMTEEVKTDAPEVRGDISTGEETGGLKTVEEVNAALGLTDEEETKDDSNATEEETTDSQEDEADGQSESGQEDSDDEGESEEDQEGDKKEDVDWEKRYKDSQRELDTKWRPLEQQIEMLAREREMLNTILADNPQAREALEKAVTGRENAKTDAQVQKSEQDISAAIQAALAPYQGVLNEQLSRKEQQELEAFEKFETKHPDLQPEDRAKIGPIAAYFENTLGLDKYEALERGYASVYPDKVYSSAKEKADAQARIDAKASEDAKRTAVGSSGSAPKSQNSGLTAEEKLVANKMGLSEDEYSEMKKLNTYE